jgi:LytR cell envelope-related transcriptional attenuator
MTDFIDVLEQQLVAAHRRPERRRFIVVPWRATIVFAGAVAAAAVVVAAVLALSSPTPQPAASSPPTQPPQTTPVHPPAPSPIAVINGTDVTGLAASTAEALTNYGYRDVVAMTSAAAGPSISKSGVSYEPGHQDLARSVAACLEISPDRVAPMTARARSAAGQADVAVFLGADKVP